ncbi:hypothetical protein CVT24_004180 [Panaeolus cyanescens]|uniref:Uncharacterized protein n=1 Tax=Panaeolus cyanescens TaxID=181874 RepID=A0A409YX95_9AGAR|nr:hypothetical protein CVT24_004180 [Panaeolus cyanescens]
MASGHITPVEPQSHASEGIEGTPAESLAMASGHITPVESHASEGIEGTPAESFARENMEFAHGTQEEDHNTVSPVSDSESKISFCLKKRGDSKPPLWYESSSPEPLSCVPNGQFNDIVPGVFFLNKISSTGKWQAWYYAKSGTWEVQGWGHKQVDGLRFIITDQKHWPGFVSEKTWEQKYKKLVIMIE